MISHFDIDYGTVKTIEPGCIIYHEFHNTTIGFEPLSWVCHKYNIQPEQLKIEIYSKEKFKAIYIGD